MDKASLLALPGIGEYTASAVCVFAYNEPCTLIETNIRSAFIHHFFSYPQKSALGPSLRDLRELSPETAFRTVLKVKDSELLPLIEKAAKGQDPREWHWALMDYGSHLKKLHKNPGRASASYVKQSKFEGSLRQMRGAILRALQKGPLSEPDLSHCAKLFRTRKLDLERMKEALSGLMRDGMVVKRKGKWGIV